MTSHVPNVAAYNALCCMHTPMAHSKWDPAGADMKLLRKFRAIITTSGFCEEFSEPEQWEKGGIEAISTLSSEISHIPRAPRNNERSGTDGNKSVRPIQSGASR